MSSKTAGSTSLRDPATDEDELKKYRQFWWKTGNIHPKAKWEEATLPYELKTDVTLEEYIFQTDKYNVKGLWEWEDGIVRVIELPSDFHGKSVATIVGELYSALRAMSFSPSGVTFSEATTSRTRGGGKDSDASLIPSGKPQVSRGGYDGKNKPWPNVVIEVAYSETEEHLTNKIEYYWLLPNRVHNAIAIKLNYTPDDTVPTEMTAWHYCVNNQTAVGALAPLMYEFGTIDRQGNPLNIQPGQCVIYIPLECIYHEMPNNFVIPSPPLSNPIPFDLFSIRWTLLNTP